MDLLRRAWAAWKRFGQMIGDFIARVVLTLFYFTIFLPFGLGVRLLSDPLNLKQRDGRWLTRQTRDLQIEDGRRLF